MPEYNVVVTATISKTDMRILSLRKIIASALIVAAVLCAALTLASPSKVVDTYRGQSMQSLGETASRMIMEQKPDSALMIYNVILGRPDLRDFPELQSKAHNNCGYLWFYHFDNAERAYRHWLDASEINEKHNLPYQETILLNIGNLFMTMEDKEKALGFHSEALKLAAMHKNHTILITTFNNMALAELGSDTVSSEFRLLETINLEDVPDSVSMKRYAMSLREALKAHRGGDWGREAEALRRSIREIDTKLTPYRYETAVLAVLGDLHRKQHRMDEAREAYLAADSVAILHGLNDFRIGLNKQLGEMFRTAGMRDSADARLRIAYSLSDSLFNYSSINGILRLETSAEIDRINIRMAEIETRRKTQQTLLYAAIGVIVLAAAFLYWISTLYRREQMKNKALYEKNIELLNLGGEGGESTKEQKTACPLSDTAMQSLAESIRGELAKPQTFDPNFGVAALARAVGSNETYVSLAIKDAYNRSFPAVLADIRMRKACEIFREDKGRKFTIEAVALQVGYRSRSSFSKVFCKITGLSPSEFVRSSRCENGN